jgi:hypothetical protein
MKLLIVTAVKAFEKEALNLFKGAKINAFSSADINGFKTDDHENLIDNWFSSSTDKVRSVLFFSFEEQTKIDILLRLLREFNQEIESDNPMRAIVLPVESFV